MKKTEKRIREISEDHYFCDLCGKGMRYYGTCSMCGRDICKKCTEYDERDNGDYPNKYCKECWEIGRIFRELEEIVRNEFEMKLEEMLEEIQKQWISEAIKNVTLKLAQVAVDRQKNRTEEDIKNSIQQVVDDVKDAND
jgi:hypothetical protein